jgi:predicted NUDIX family NTP pyrophosphohydrolase
MYRRAGEILEVLLVHPGGPYWHKQDEGAWSIPKGEMDDGEDAEAAARREFMKETGLALLGPLDSLGEIRQRGGKRVIAFAIEGDVDVSTTSMHRSRSIFSTDISRFALPARAGCHRHCRSI